MFIREEIHNCSENIYLANFKQWAKRSNCSSFPVMLANAKVFPKLFLFHLVKERQNFVDLTI